MPGESRWRNCHVSGASSTPVSPFVRMPCSSWRTRFCAGTEGSTQLSLEAMSTRTGCDEPWPRCRYHELLTAGWSWPSTSPAGCGRTPTPHLSGSCVTPMAEARTSTFPCPAGRTRSSARCNPAAARGPHRWTRCVSPPGGDTATVTARQLRELVKRLIAAGQWQSGDPNVLVIADAGYDAPRLAHLLKDLPVQVLARMRSDRVLRRPTRRGSLTPRAVRPGAAASSSSGSPTPGAPRTRKPLPKPASTALPPPGPGTGSAPSSPTARPGPRLTAPFRSSKAP